MNQEARTYSLPIDAVGVANDEMLVLAAKSGEQSAFAELCHRHSRKVERAIYPIIRDASETEDILQETFLRAFVHLDRFEARSMFSTWVIRIAINSALMALRKRRNHRECSTDHSLDENMQETREVPDSTIDIERDYAQLECVMQLREAVRLLRPNLREVVDLKLSRELSNKEIAATLGISIASVKTRLYRAKVALRHTMSGGSSETHPLVSAQ